MFHFPNSNIYHPLLALFADAFSGSKVKVGDINRTVYSIDSGERRAESAPEHLGSWCTERLPLIHIIELFKSSQVKSHWESTHNNMLQYVVSIAVLALQLLLMFDFLVYFPILSRYYLACVSSFVSPVLLRKFKGRCNYWILVCAKQQFLGIPVLFSIYFFLNRHLIKECDNFMKSYIFFLIGSIYPPTGRHVNAELA